MGKRRLKNLVILVLVFSACIQTGRLWLGEEAGRAFFYFLEDAFDQTDSEGPEGSVIAPSRIVTGAGNKRFAAVSHGEDTQEVEALAYRFLEEVAQSGSFAVTESADWAAYLAGRVLVLEYPFAIAMSEYVKGFSGRGQALSGRVDTFETLVILPARLGEGESRVYFLSADLAVGFTLPGSEASEALYEALGSFAPANRLSYISAQQNGLYLFPDDAFLPQWQAGSWEYAVVEKVNPFVADAGGDMTAPLEGFFDNISTTTRHLDPDTGAYVVSDSDRVVKYYPAGVLEYYNYESVKESEQTLATAYTTAIAFLAGKDVSLNGNYVLVDAELKSDGLTLYFDYTVNGLPLYLSEALKSDLGLSHALEVVVQNNVVRKYKKLAYYFSLSEAETDAVETDFLWALDETVAAFAPDEATTQVQDIGLGYLADTDGRCYLKWFVSLDGQQVLQDIKEPEPEKPEAGTGQPEAGTPGTGAAAGAKE